MGSQRTGPGRILGVAVLVLAFAAPCAADQPRVDAAALTLDEAIVLAIEHAPKLHEARAKVALAHLDVRATRWWTWLIPMVTAHQGFPFVSWHSEVLYRRYEAAARTSADDSTILLPAETLSDRGVYSQVLWGIKPRVVAGLRGEFTSGDNGAFDSQLRGARFRLSPNMTLYPTEFSKVRLQYNYDHRKGIGGDHSVWLQFEFLLGAHASHKF